MKLILQTENFSLLQLQPQIYQLRFKEQYLLGMTFCRYQEFYESPSPNFNSKCFDLFDFMEWWVKNYSRDGSFDYPLVWEGYNLTSDTLANCINAFHQFPDARPTKYDLWMDEIYSAILADLPEANTKFSLLGTYQCKDEQITLEHEMAHAFFFLNPDYQQHTLQLIKDNLLPEQISEFNAILAKMGYTQSVFEDEIQAYLATGLLPNMKTHVNISTNTETKFRDYFLQYYNVKV